MRKFILVIGCFLIFISSSVGQDTLTLKKSEKEYLNLFKNFKAYLVNCISNNCDISDSSNMKHVLLNYIISDFNLDTTNKSHFKKNEIPEEKLIRFERQLRLFYQYFFERKKASIAEHLNAIPMRLSFDQCMYEKFTTFQRENTFVYFDDRKPTVPLGYILFVPKFNEKIYEPRIWSWTLQFNMGIWAFESLMGEVGMEHFISEGVKGPEHPIGN